MLDHSDLLMVEYLSKKYDEANMSLYLSYPVSSYWKMELSEQDLVKAYDFDRTPLLYFHFPYCARACFYCACYKTTSNDIESNDTYIRYLKKEFDKKCRLLGIERFKNVRHMHWGGGTPTRMSCSQLETIFRYISRKIDYVSDSNTSFSIEAFPDPKELTVEKLVLLRNLGFNEISLGIQDFSENIQNVIGRHNSKDMVSEVISACHDLGFRVHLDLCYGLPFQGLGEFAETVQSVIRMDPDRIAMFSYAHHPLLFPLQRKIPSMSIPNSFIRVILNINATNIFTSSGYYKVGLDHFVKNDNSLYRASINRNVVRDFMGCSVSQRSNFFGFGNASISFLRNTYFQNNILIRDYISSLDRNQIPFHNKSGHVLSVDDQMRHKLIQRHILGNFIIPKKDLSLRYSIDFDSYFEKELEALEEFVDDGLISKTCSDTISFTDIGRYFARHIASVFDNYN